ncbi:MAG: hypothetical protein HQK54_12135 [Oligoflexales bacterium]|nr:hypothetical protein [Oligoflexales bacterium]
MNRISVFTLLPLAASLMMAFPDYTVESTAYARNSSDSPLIDLNAGVGIPRLIGFDLAFTRLYPVTFGFGLGTIPIESAVKKQLDIKPEDYEQEVNGYRLIPSFSLRWKSIETFLRWHPWDMGFYVQALYAIWAINGSVSVTATSGQLKDSRLYLGSVSLSMIQPILGLTFGWRWFFGDSGIYTELGTGILYFRKPYYSVGIYTAADPFTSAIPEENRKQIDDAKTQIRTEVDKAMQEYHSILTYAPMLAISIGMVI